MAEYTAIAEQTVNPGESIVFTESPEPCARRMIRHRDGTGNFLLSGRTTCICKNAANYSVFFGANIAIPTGGTVESITVAFAVDGATVPGSTMEITPTAVSSYNHVSNEIDVPIWSGCCETVTIRNTSAQPILVKQAVVNFGRPDLVVSR